MRFIIACLAGFLASPAAFPADQITFKALWWSSAQMEGLDPNSPPPKETEVVLKKWEYSDPIGVPNPDEIDVEFSTADLKANPKLELQWQIGRLKNKASATWSKAEATGITPAFDQKDNRRVFRFKGISIKKKTEGLFPEKWPWALKARVRAGDGPKAKVLAEAILPITPGD